MADCVALIVAAGRGHRVGGEVPKQYLPLAGQAVLRHTAGRLLDHPDIDAVRVVINPDDRALYDAAIHGLDLMPPVAGGAVRQASVRNGLESLTEDPPCRVLIHDAARPLVDRPSLDRLIAALDQADAAILAVPVSDTLKRAQTETIETTVARDGLWRAQTPQGFRFDLILAAHRAAGSIELTDDAAVAEYAGIPVQLVLGVETNLKVTTADDFARAEQLLAVAPAETRIGSGFDVHKFGAGDFVMLCGVRVPHAFGLTGHSDGDVGLHAVVDALLGTIGEADIGAHFPSTDPRWAGADSSIFLTHARDLVAEAGGVIVNVDVTVICAAPKLSPHRAAMVARLAELLQIAPERVSVKATTTDGIGFTGRGEGIAGQAAVAVRFGG